MLHDFIRFDWYTSFNKIAQAIFQKFARVEKFLQDTALKKYVSMDGAY